MKKNLFLALATCVFLTSHECQALTLYVATTGSDANAGTKSAPFTTLERARDEIRRLNQAGSLPSSGVTVSVGKGTYRLDKSLVLDSRDSGGTSAPVVWQAESTGKVRLSGGKVLPSAGFQPVVNPQILDRLDPSARDKVLVTDLGALGITELGTYPDSYRGAAAVPELFFNEQRMTLARWPNEGWATIAKVINRGKFAEAGKPQGSTNQVLSPGSFTYDGNRPNHWRLDQGVWLHGYWAFDWYDEVIKVEKIDTNQQEIVLAAPSRYGLGFGNPSPRRYRAINLLEELDEPGEYYIDRTSDFLYLWPPGTLAGARIELSLLNEPLLIMTNVSHVTFHGFVFDENVGGTVLVRNTYYSRNQPGNDKPAAGGESTGDRVILDKKNGEGVLIGGSHDIRLESCEIRNMRQLGVRIVSSTHCAVVSCNFHDTGTGGLMLDGGDRKTLQRGDNEAVDNRFWKCSQNQLTYGSSLTLSGVGNHAAHNEISDTPHMGIGIVGNDHVFEFNYVHDVCTASDDSGALYKGRDPSCRGNIIRDNFWKDIGAAMGHGTAAIYFDDGDGGDVVAGNIFLRCGSPGKGGFGTVFSHGGHDLVVENNIFIGSGRALGSVPWNDTKWKLWITNTVWQKRLLQDVDITRPPYTTHYPELVGFMDARPQATRFSHAQNNLLVECQEAANGNWTNSPGALWMTAEDPGFVNLAKDDLRLRRNAAVFKHLPGFNPTPFEKIGIEPKASPPPVAH